MRSATCCVCNWHKALRSVIDHIAQVFSRTAFTPMIHHSLLSLLIFYYPSIKRYRSATYRTISALIQFFNLLYCVSTKRIETSLASSKCEIFNSVSISDYPFTRLVIVAKTCICVARYLVTLHLLAPFPFAKNVHSDQSNYVTY